MSNDELPALPDETAMRAEFHRQHEGRNLTQHRLRGTYSSPPIAALWNQHRRTAKWMARRAATFSVPEGFALVPLDPPIAMLNEIRLTKLFSDDALRFRYAEMLRVYQAISNA